MVFARELKKLWKVSDSETNCNCGVLDGLQKNWIRDWTSWKSGDEQQLSRLALLRLPRMLKSVLKRHTVITKVRQNNAGVKNAQGVYE